MYGDYGYPERAVEPIEPDEFDRQLALIKEIYGDVFAKLEDDKYWENQVNALEEREDIQFNTIEEWLEALSKEGKDE